MSDHIEFDTDQQGMPKGASHLASRTILERQEPRGISAWLIRHGIIRGDSGAKAVMIGIVLINFIAAALIVYFFVLR